MLRSAAEFVYGSANYQNPEDDYYERPEVASKVYVCNR